MRPIAHSECPKKTRPLFGGNLRVVRALVVGSGTRSSLFDTSFVRRSCILIDPMWFWAKAKKIMEECLKMIQNVYTSLVLLGPRTSSCQEAYPVPP